MWLLVAETVNLLVNIAWSIRTPSTLGSFVLPKDLSGLRLASLQSVMIWLKPYSVFHGLVTLTPVPAPEPAY
jgi:hypothetical protein